jgi:diguanylate cyclase (GGDEF)-like protein
MGNQLDIATIMAIMVMNHLIMFVALWITFASKQRYGIDFWLYSILMQAVGDFLILLRGFAPDFISVIAANTSLSISHALYYVSFCRFYSLPVRRAYLIAPVVITFLLFWIFIGDYATRVLVAGVIFSIQYFLVAVILMAPSSVASTRLKRLLWVSFCAMGMIFVLRAVAVIIDRGHFVSFFPSEPVQTLSMLGFEAGLILINFTVILLHYERIGRENERLATLDALTEIFNRRTFADLMRRELARGERKAQSVAFFMLDVDHFKQINDKYGHLAGDAVLVKLVEVLRGCIRSQDLIARYGGEEFCILMTDASPKDAEEVAERLRTSVAMQNFVIDHKSVHITISIGIACLVLSIGSNIERIYALADIALYQAKKDGRNCWRLNTDGNLP